MKYVPLFILLLVGLSASSCSFYAPYWVASGAMGLGLSPEASLELESGEELEGEIVSSTSDAILIRQSDAHFFPALDESATLVTVPRSEVVDIDHPGNVVMVLATPIALVFTGIGGVGWVVMAESGDPWGSLAGLTIGILGTAAAIPFYADVVAGTILWMGSRSAAEPSSVAWSAAPLVFQMEDETWGGGLSLRATW